MSRKLDGRPGKTIDSAVYLPLRKQAARRAQRLEQNHSLSDTALPNDNPSSGMRHLLRALEP
jgi:hypothetical protein